LHIWTPDALLSEARPFQRECWRLVEAQHRVSTLKLVDTLEEQDVLEKLIEETKPVIPPECRQLHYLLSTPFRYGTLYPRGSRFRRAGYTLGVYYASEEPSTAVAEMAFYRLLFFSESPDTPWPSDPGEYTAFAAVAGTECIDLASPPFSQHRQHWTDPNDYKATQELADVARAANIKIIRYESVRDPQARANIALLTCRAFLDAQPNKRQTWRLRLSGSGIQVICEFPELRISFDRNTFMADTRLKGLNWDR
jgi:RES domain